MFHSCQQLFPVETWGAGLYRSCSWEGLHGPLGFVLIMGTFLCAQRAPLPSLRGL